MHQGVRHLFPGWFVHEDLAAAGRVGVDDLFLGIDALSQNPAGGGYPGEPDRPNGLRFLGRGIPQLFG